MLTIVIVEVTNLPFSSLADAAASTYSCFLCCSRSWLHLHQLKSSTHSTSHTVVNMKLRLDVTHVSKELAKHCLAVTAVTRLDTTHSLGRFPVNLHCAVSMGTESLERRHRRTKKLHNDSSENYHTSKSSTMVFISL